ncbi:MAG: PDDEXK nuclease domain-containing protein [Planctomycetota bacterium]|nr:PDDEXK nuclease domain-containing protein [Planctomycetota bacterium]
MNKIVKSGYYTLLNNVSSLLQEARRQTVRQINTVITTTYWHTGRLIIEEEQKGKERAGYGEYLIKRLSDDLTKRFGKGFTVVNIWNMRQFYLTYSKLYALRRESRRDKISHALRDQLTWTHFRTLMRVDDKLARQFYEIETVKNNWSSRELERQINSLLFERLSLSKNKKKVLSLAQKGQVITTPEDAVKDPYVLEFLGIPEKSYYTETQLEQKLIDHLQEFILELGKGFTFVARQKRITIDNEHYYIDMVFYHRILRCLILIDLKIGVLAHSDVGQMNFYLNYIKDKEMIESENQPVGIILCTERTKGRVFVEYALGGITNKIFVSKYKLYLPTKTQLEAEIRKETERLKRSRGV